MKHLTPIFALATAMALTVPAFSQTAADPVTPTAPAASTETSTTTPMSSDSTVTTTTSAFMVPEGYTAVTDWSGVTAEQLKGATLYAVDGTNIGSISDIHLGADGKIDGIITDVGGFLGMGVHTVNLGLSDISIYRDASEKLIASTPLTADALKALPEYTPS